MTSTTGAPFFSIIIATRNRPSLFATALKSVLDQEFRNLEVIVVNDGSSEEHRGHYDEVLKPVSDSVRLLALVRTERGHGQSYALNFGAAHARGDYLCFLDDDDQWTDAGHLARVAEVAAASGGRPDLILANQRAFLNGVPAARVVWIEDLADRLRRKPDLAGAYIVTPDELLACRAHCHLNTTVVARDFYLAIGGLDEGLRYECDRDFYLRAIDRAKLIAFLPNIVSRHNIPDPVAKSSMSTAESELSKRLYQLRVCDKALLFSRRPELRRYAMRHRLYALEHLAREAARGGRDDSARIYRWEAWMAKLVLSWVAVAGRLAR